MPTRVRSFAKINLGLAIGPVREDGFHGLATLYQTIDAHDLVTVAAEPLRVGEPSRIVISSSDRRVPLDARNTVWKMLARVLAEEPYRVCGWAVRVHIEKRLPMQGGLGAGSANAVAALVALEQETGLALARDERLRIAAEVGSDVPLFLIGGAVLGLGRGEQVYPMPDLVADLVADLAGDPAGEPVAVDSPQAEAGAEPGAEPAPGPVEVVLALPGLGVSTPQAFRDWDALRAAAEADGLTAAASSDKLEELSRALAAALSEPQTSSGVSPAHVREDLARHPLAALVRTGIRNDFEEVVFRQHPILGTIRRALLGLDEASTGEAAPGSVFHGTAGQAGVLYAALSGSGSALFGLYSDRNAAEAAEATLGTMGVRTLRSRLLSRDAYWRQMAAPGEI